MSNWKHHQFTNEELKKLVSEVYDQKIFTSFHCDSNTVTMVFMPILFLGARPSFPGKSDDIKIDRKNKLEHVSEIIEYEEQTEIREEYINNIGMVYEYYDKAGPRSINGYPIFMSMHILSKEDTKRFIEMYQKYEEMRKEFEKEW